jgi:hypothetical protein
MGRDSLNIYRPKSPGESILEREGIYYWAQLISGSIRYRRGIDKITGQYVFDYSIDGGITWETLMSLNPTEDSIIMDSTHIYRHRIVGTSYHIDQTLTPTGYAGIENTDWENIYST